MCLSSSALALEAYSTGRDKINVRFDHSHRMNERLGTRLPKFMGLIALATRVPQNIAVHAKHSYVLCLACTAMFYTLHL